MTSPTSPLAPLKIRLYIAGDGPNSLLATRNLKSALERTTGRTIDLEVIDVVANPERGIAAGIFVTPMLVKLEPAPERRILGNLQDRVTLLTALGLTEVPVE